MSTTNWNESAGLFSPVWLMDEEGRLIGYRDFQDRFYAIPQSFRGTTRPTDQDPEVAGTAPSSGGTWGSIVGSLENQVDLKEKFDAKLDVVLYEQEKTAKADKVAVEESLLLKAPLLDPVFAGDPEAPTQAAGTNDGRLATCAFVQTELAGRAPLANPSFTGVPSAPTAAFGTSTTQIATTAFVQASLTSRAPSADPSFTGIPTAPTAVAGTNTTQLATCQFVQAAVNPLMPKSGGTFTAAIFAPTPVISSNDTTVATTAFVVSKIAAIPAPTISWGQISGLLTGQTDLKNALDAKLDATVYNAAIVQKAPLADPAFTGVPTAPTPVTSTNTAQLATTAFVQSCLAPFALLAGPAFTGVPTAPTAVAGTSTTQLATTAFVQNALTPYAAKASPALTGTPTAPTAALNTNSTQIATCAFVQQSLGQFAKLFTGTGMPSNTLGNDGDYGFRTDPGYFLQPIRKVSGNWQLMADTPYTIATLPAPSSMPQATILVVDTTYCPGGKLFESVTRDGGATYFWEPLDKEWDILLDLAPEGAHNAGTNASQSIGGVFTLPNASSLYPTGLRIRTEVGLTAIGQNGSKTFEAFITSALNAGSASMLVQANSSAITVQSVALANTITVTGAGVGHSHPFSAGDYGSSGPYSTYSLASSTWAGATVQFQKRLASTADTSRAIKRQITFQYPKR